MQSAVQSDYAKFYSCSHNAVIRVYDAAGNVIEMHEHAGEFTESGEALEWDEASVWGYTSPCMVLGLESEWALLSQSESGSV
jgi:hypothetical protein